MVNIKHNNTFLHSGNSISYQIYHMESPDGSDQYPSRLSSYLTKWQTNSAGEPTAGHKSQDFPLLSPGTGIQRVIASKCGCSPHLPWLIATMETSPPWIYLIPFWSCLSLWPLVHFLLGHSIVFITLCVKEVSHFRSCSPTNQPFLFPYICATFVIYNSGNLLYSLIFFSF